MTLLFMGLMTTLTFLTMFAFSIKAASLATAYHCHRGRRWQLIPFVGNFVGGISNY